MTNHYPRNNCRLSIFQRHNSAFVFFGLPKRVTIKKISFSHFWKLYNSSFCFGLSFVNNLYLQKKINVHIMNLKSTLIFKFFYKVFKYQFSPLLNNFGPMTLRLWNQHLYSIPSNKLNTNRTNPLIMLDVLTSRN